MSHKLDSALQAQVRARTMAEWGLDVATTDALLRAAVIREFPRGSAIYPQGTHRNSVFLVIAGVVSMSIALPNGQRILCTFQQPGAMFGFPLVEGERVRWSATDAFTTATVGLIPRRDFERILAELPTAAVIRFFNQALERQARLAMRLVQCVALDVRGRLALTLVDLAQTFGVVDGAGVRVQLPITHENLAEMTGASRERISRGMAALMAEGLITYARQAVTVCDLAGLRQAAIRTE